MKDRVDRLEKEIEDLKQFRKKVLDLILKASKLEQENARASMTSIYYALKG